MLDTNVAEQCDAMMEDALKDLKLEYPSEDCCPKQSLIDEARECLEILVKNGYKPKIYITCCGSYQFIFGSGCRLTKPTEHFGTSHWTFSSDKDYRINMSSEYEIDILLKMLSINNAKY